LVPSAGIKKFFENRRRWGKRIGVRAPGKLCTLLNELSVSMLSPYVILGSQQTGPPVEISPHNPGSPLARFSHPGRRYPPIKVSPLIPSATTVRCFSLAFVSCTQASIVPDRSFARPPQSPLRDLCDLRAMLSPCARFSHPSPALPPLGVSPTTANPPSVTFPCRTLNAKR
jgi:hypothetical protein